MAFKRTSSLLSFGFTAVDAFKSAIPPPATIPSLIAAFVAHIASSTLSAFSLSSISEFAPTFTTATFADSLDNLFSNLITSAGLVDLANSFLISSISASTSSLSRLTWNIVSNSVVTVLMQVPSISGVIKSTSSPRSSFITVAPVSRAKSDNISFLLIPYVGELITFTFILPLFLFIASADITAGSQSATISNALLFFITYSSTLCIFLILSTGDSTRSISGFSSSAVLED